DLVPHLIEVLAEPDPSEPFQKEEDGKTVWAVRELVKINHHRNCLLCHAPADPGPLRGTPVGLVPSPVEPMPPSRSTAYYAERNGSTLARADITYLRQDFSLML